MSHNVTPNTSRVELRKTLTLVPVVMMGLAYMQPMTLFDTFGPGFGSAFSFCL